MHKLTTSIVVCMCALPLFVQAERYRVEEDSFGEYSAKKVEEVPLESTSESNPITLPLQDQQEREANQPPDPSVKPKQKKVVSNKFLGDVGEKLSPFEKAFIENETRESERILRSIKGAPKTESTDATEINPEDFVDGDELLKNGGRRGDQAPAYYTVVEADGTIRNIEYDPDAIHEALDNEAKVKIEFTQANVLSDSGPGVKLPELADSYAAALFTSGETSNDYFKQFAASCCDTLPELDLIELERGKGHYVELSEEMLPYRFSGGDSRFLLLSVPETKSPQALKLRSFIRRHKRHDIDHGVFFPQLITLDKDRKPLRIFTGPLLKYHAETWLAHGFLEGIFQIDSTEEGGEKYLLLNTTREILKQSSSIEDVQGLITIDHMEIGTIALELLVEENI